MKTRSDKTISMTIIGYGVFFILLIVLTNFDLSNFTILWACLGTLIILAGIWKIETFELSENTLTKTNFARLFSRRIDLNNIIRYDNKSIDLDNYHFKNPFSIIGLFTKNKKYFIFRQIIIKTENNRKLKIDERTINTDDFNTLYSKIKGYKGRQKK